LVTHLKLTDFNFDHHWSHIQLRPSLVPYTFFYEKPIILQTGTEKETKTERERETGRERERDSLMPSMFT